MPSRLRRDFHRAAFNNLSVFISYFERLSNVPAVQSVFNKVPDVVKGDRTMTQIVMDDLMDSFAFIMRGIPDDQIPLSFYKQLLDTRFGAEVSDDDVKTHIDIVLKAKRAIPASEDNPPPELLSVLTQNVPDVIARNMVANYINMLNNIRQLTFNDEALSSTQDGNKLTAQVQKGFSAIVEGINKRNAVINALKKTTANDDFDEAEDDEEDIGEDSLDDLTARVKAAKLTGEAKERAYKELRKLKQMNPASSEYSVVFNYIDTLASLPWKKVPEVKHDIKAAKDILDNDHYGLEKVKEAVLEFIAVQNQTGKPGGQILCIDGPPGTGKTSITKSIARALGREYIRVSLGGVSDEAEIRGHRSTYIGAMPGKIIKAMKKAGVTNPLINLDEIDKMGQNTRGDPTAAMLEVLDPAQNSTFHDHYLGVDYDLSNVMFVCTSNDLAQIPRPLRDRLEIIHFGGYTKDEKFEIGKKHLVSKQMEQSGLRADQFSIDDTALRNIISDYTAESGVRRLESRIKQVCRKVVRIIQETDVDSVHVTADTLPVLIGPPRGRKQTIKPNDRVGLVNGLAYTSIGGCTLPIEAVVMDGPGNGFRVTATGRLGEMMRENVEYVQNMIESHAKEFGLEPATLRKLHVHLHAPEAAVPKDGPSAGIAMSTAVLSVLTGKKIRRDIAMTGEVTVHGDVGAIGGLPEKLEGAVEAGVKTVLIPKDNEKDLVDVPESIKSKLTIIPVSTIKQVFEKVFIEPLTINDDPTPEEMCRVFNFMAKKAGNDNRFTAVVAELMQANGALVPRPA